MTAANANFGIFRNNIVPIQTENGRQAAGERHKDSAAVFNVI